MFAYKGRIYNSKEEFDLTFKNETGVSLDGKPVVKEVPLVDEKPIVAFNAEKAPSVKTEIIDEEKASKKK